MKQTEQAPPQFWNGRLSKTVKWLVPGLALACYLFVLAATLTPQFFSFKTGWIETLLLLTTAAFTLLVLADQLPVQNVLLAFAGIAFIGGVAHAIASATAIPFGPFTFTDNFGPRLFRHFALCAPLVWVVVILNSRGVARLILRPWRKLHTYGLWLIGITVVLTTVFGAALDPFATRVRRYWLWDRTTLALKWHGAPLTCLLGWLLVSLLIMVFVTPALINKNPRKLAPDYRPLVVWVLCLVLFAAGAATRQLWSAVVLCVCAIVGVSIAAVRGAR